MTMAGQQWYESFLARKAHSDSESGFDPVFMPDDLFDFQRALTTWAVRKGRAAIFADCGLGKTLMQLAWAENVVRRTNQPILILTPLAVTHQTIAEAEKFGIEARRAEPGCGRAGIAVTNYERLHHFDPADFGGAVCDESSILKSFDGVRRQQITDFMRKMSYRLLCTATAAPNDYIELGTSSEALGYLGHSDMLTRFFKNDANNIASGRQWGGVVQWRFKGHAETPFWRWVCSWARAIRRPSDFGYSNHRFNLPKLDERSHLVDQATPPDGRLFALPAVGLQEQREERRRTITERCERAAELCPPSGQSLLWCHLNDEGDLLERIVPGAVQIRGRDHDDAKEEKFIAFASGKVQRLVVKPKIGAWGLNFQNCAHMTMFPSHSFEQYYQAVRRCWRFGQQRDVVVDIVTSEGEKSVLANMQRKSAAADKMFDRIVAYMNDAMSIERQNMASQQERLPAWL